MSAGRRKVPGRNRGARFAGGKAGSITPVPPGGGIDDDVGGGGLIQDDVGGGGQIEDAQ